MRNEIMEIIDRELANAKRKQSLDFKHYIRLQDFLNKMKNEINNLQEKSITEECKIATN